jgi:capsular polysaccharide transport system permease protein
VAARSRPREEAPPLTAVPPAAPAAAEERKFSRAAMRTEIGGDDRRAFRRVQRAMLRAALAASFLAAVYWGFIAVNRYVSEAHVIVQRTDVGSDNGGNLRSMLSGEPTMAAAEQLLLRDHLMSIDMLKKLDATLHLRQHYSEWRWDPLSQLWIENDWVEWFHRYYLSRVEIEQDDRSGILIIKAQGFDAVTAHAVTDMLVQEGEHYMNELSHRLARDQVAFLEKQVVDNSQRVKATRSALIEFQNKEGLSSPTATADALTTVTHGMQSQVADLKAKRSDLLTYLSPKAPDVVRLNSQIAAIESQIVSEQGRLASNNGKSLNRVVEEYQRLELDAKFAMDMYQTALVALEKGRIETTRNIKKLSVLQSPTRPEYPIEPRRLYNILVFVLCAMVLTGILHLIIAVIRDHKD